MLESPANDVVTAHFSRYEAFVTDLEKWLGRRADRFHWYYNVSRVAIIILGVLVPSLSTGLFGEKGKEVAPFAALAIAGLVSLDGLLKPGENWRHFRSYQLALQRSRRIFESRCSELELEADPHKRHQKGLALYREFVSEIEQLLEQEAKLFFDRRIQQLTAVNEETK